MWTTLTHAKACRKTGHESSVKLATPEKFLENLFFGGGVEFGVMQSELSQPEVEKSLEVLLIAILWVAAHPEGAT